MLWDLLLFAAGIALLTFGGNALVDGSSRLAAIFGVSPLVIGLTVVAFGTSAPELAVTMSSAAAGQADLAAGNVVGSNIFNILGVLGLSALIAPLAVDHTVVRREIPVMIVASLAFYYFGRDGLVSRIDGAILFAALLAYAGYQVIAARRESAAERAGDDDTPSVPPGARAWLRNGFWIVVGIGLLVAGSELLVRASVSFARSLGVSELVIGLTIVSVGTSLPEVVTSLTAAFRGEREIAVGNAVGSCIFNILCVLGLAGLIAPGGISVATGLLAFDAPVMIAVAIVCLPLAFTGLCIERWEGGLFALYYAAYATFLVLDATAHPFAGRFGDAMLWFVMPLTALGLGVVFFQGWRRRRRLSAPAA